ncbi:hypothetical protein ES702_05678 [subsurface metagenome]
MKEKDKLTDQEFLEAVKIAGLEDFLTSYTQKISDKRVSNGIETFKKNLGEKDLSDKEEIELLKNELKDLKGTMTKKDMDTLIKAELKAQNLSEGLIKYITVKDAKDIGEQVKGLKDELLAVQQGDIDKKLEGTTSPAKGLPTGTDSTLESFIESKNKGQGVSSPFKGKLESNEVTK